MIACYL